LLKTEAADQKVSSFVNRDLCGPYETDFFFVPVYVSCNFSTVNGFPAIGHARSLISSAVRLISSKYPFWNRTWGSDHVFVASHEYGAYFHAMVRERKKNQNLSIDGATCIALPANDGEERASK
jgi:hypothetical protein